MKSLSKREAKSKANAGLISYKEFFDLYSGIDGVDCSGKPLKFLVYDGKEGFFAEPATGFDIYFAIKYSEIEKIEYIGMAAASGNINDRIKGAVAGGLLLGPIGALAGAIQSDKYLLAFVLKDGSEIIMGFDDYKKKDVEKFLDRALPSGITFDKQMHTRKNETKTESTISVADELLKYKQLLDMGALTQDEFDKKKAELLNK